MNEEEIRTEIKRRKEVFRREQMALSFAEKVRIAFALAKRRTMIKQARLLEQNDVVAPTKHGSQ